MRRFQGRGRRQPLADPRRQGRVDVEAGEDALALPGGAEREGAGQLVLARRLSRGEGDLVEAAAANQVRLERVGLLGVVGRRRVEQAADLGEQR